jgi:hypothetical protein
MGMVDHSEFPWGPQYEPGVLTPLGVIGWVIASALLLALLLQLFNPSSGRKAGANLDDIHKIVLAASRYALKQDEFGILRGADVLRRVLRSYLGGLLMGGGALGKQMKALGTAMGEADDSKKKDEHGKGGHGAGHAANGDNGHGGHGADPAVAANTVQGHSITVNVGGESNGHGEHGDDEKPLGLEDQLVAVRKAVREFEAWWSDKPARMAELRAAHDDLTRNKKPDPALIALLEDKK